MAVATLCCGRSRMRSWRRSTGSTRIPLYLKGCKLDPALRATASFSDLADRDAWIVVTPAQHMRAVLSRLPCPEMPLVLCSKGIEEGTRQDAARGGARGLPDLADRRPLRSVLRARGRRGASHRGHPGVRGPRAGRAASRTIELARLPHLSQRRRRRRGGRRSGQERARDRLRNRRGPPSRPERARRADRARLHGNDPLRAGQGRAARDACRPRRASATSSSPVRRRARAISRSARGSARAGRWPS